MNRSDRAKLMVSLLDYTLLGDQDTEKDIEQHCAGAINDLGKVAAVCIYPRFIKLASELLNGQGIKIATVINFPSGEEDSEQYLKIAEQAVSDGADELDFVFPYKTWLAGDHDKALKSIANMAEFRKNGSALKLIIETGELKKSEIIQQVSNECLDIGVDFLKTSTGKTAVSATPEAAEIMLAAIKSKAPLTGFKSSGGIRKFEEANLYLKLAEQSYNLEKMTPSLFRFGASSLLKDLLDTPTIPSDMAY